MSAESTKQVVLIVGGGSGIGADSAKKLAASGYDVGVMSSSGKGEALGNELGGLGFTGSMLEPDPDFPTSAVFRSAFAGYTKLFSTKYAREGIRMNNVLPGFIDSLPEKEERVARIPAGRYARVEELSNTVAFMISDDSSYITGQNLRVDGGLTASV